MKRFGRFIVALKELDGEPPEIFRIHRTLDRFLDVRDGVLDASCKNVRKLMPPSRSRFLLCPLRRLNGHLRGMHGVLAVQRADFDRVTSELFPELLRIDRIAALSDEIHHIKCKNNRKSDLDQLGGEVQVSLDVRSVDDIQNDIRFLVDQIISGNDFLQRVRAQRVDSRKVLDDDVLVAREASFLLLDRDARPVSDVLGAARQIIKQRGLSAVRISCECYFYAHSFLFSARFLSRFRKGDSLYCSSTGNAHRCAFPRDL